VEKNETLLWIGAWLTSCVLGAAWLCKSELDTLYHRFETDSRIAHRLLTQRTVQHDTILATLAAGVSNGVAQCAEHARARIKEMYPQVTAVMCGPSRLARAVSAHPAASGFEEGRYWLTLDGQDKHWALQIDIIKMISGSEWPASSMHIELHNGSRHAVLQERGQPLGDWDFQFSKKLASDSQPFTLVTRQHVGWANLPWRSIAAWVMVAAIALAAGVAWRLQWIGRHRAERLLRLRKVERLNALGELAAGMAHELNQPLTAILANCQAAKRLLNVEQPDLGKARDALGHAVEQAKRAAQVITRLRNAIGQTNQPGANRTLPLNEAVNNAVHLLVPEFRQRQVALLQSSSVHALMVSADPVELDQVLHNLLMNALQALEQVPANERELHIAIESRGEQATVRIADSGPGIPQAALPHLFEPFFTTREGGLGLGLSLCETLVGGMGGSLSAANRSPRGAELLLSLPQVPS